MDSSKKVARIEVRLTPELKAEFESSCQRQGSNISKTLRAFIDHSTAKKRRLIKPSIVILFVLMSLCVISASYFIDSQPESPLTLKTKFVFAHYDFNSDGSLTIEDFKNNHKKMIAEDNELNLFGRPYDKEKYKSWYSPKNHFDRLDTNEDSEISLDELSTDL